MLLPRATRARALLCLFLCLDLAAATRFVGVRRDDGSTSATLSSKMPSINTSADPSSATDGSNVGSNSTTAGPSSSSTSLVNTTSATTMVSSMTAAPTPIDSNPSNTTLFNNTIPEGQLPLTPTITPAFGVAGIILIGTGIGYGFVGIKSRWVHSFMAAAYLGSLGTSILILYVMSPPVSNGIQGAYIVAIVLTGLILGGAALVFKEITEFLGSLLGGFCLGMWLICLGSGGVVHETGAKVGFILAFTLAAFATYFHSWTRHYGLMASISFAGATAAVLGIDCFSRAGLKEFWVYVWALNDRLFPVGADTYPLTRGIKVELAAVIMVFLAGMLSQVKIWRVIQKQRDQRERHRAEARRAIETEDLGIGQHVERLTHRERRQWERVYGDGAEKGFADSGVGGMGSSVKLPAGGPGVRGSRVVSPASPGEGRFQMVEIPLVDGGGVASNRRRTVDFHQTRTTRSSVRLSRIPAPTRQDSGSRSENAGADVPKIWVVGEDGEARLEDKSEGSSRTFSPGPEIVPLPFTIRTGDEDEVPDDRSSVAAVDEEGEERLLPADSRRNSLAKRLSVGSGKILRNLSQRSKTHTVASNEGAGESREELVVSRRSAREDDDNSSLAATLDDLSSDGRDDELDGEGSTRRYSDVERPLSQELRKSEEKSTRAWLSPADSKSGEARLSVAETTSTRPQSTVEGEEATADEAKPSTKPVDDATGPGKEWETAEPKTESHVSAEPPVPAALKPEHLPRPLSRVAMSYRTNEWAKHLSRAEAPEPADVGGVPEPIVEAKEEAAAPLDVEELQKTADNAARPVAAPRSASAMSSYSTTPQPVLSRTNSKASLQQAESRNISPTGPSFPPQVHKNPKRGANIRRTSAQFVSEPIAEECDVEEAAVSRSPTIPEEGGGASRSHSPNSTPSPIDAMQIYALASSSQPNLTRPPVPGVMSYSSPQSLIAKRETLLRNRSQASFYAPESGMLPTIHSHPSSEADLGIPSSSSSRASLEANPDLDDLPMSTRRQILRQSSLDTPGSGVQQQQPYLHLASAASNSNFDSHQPIHRRVSASSGLNAMGAYIPSESARQAQLASFRTSVQADLRQGATWSPQGGLRQGATWSPYGGGAPGSASVTRVYSGGLGEYDGEVTRSVNQSRSFLMGQKEAEAQRREMERLERERNNAEFEERMRRGELLDAHRDAMRRLQGGVKDL